MDGSLARVVLEVGADGVGLIEVRGYLNEQLADLVAAAGDELRRAGCGTLVIELSEVELTNCRGMRGLVSLASRVRCEGGSLLLSGVRPTQWRILRTLCDGLDLTVDPSTAAAPAPNCRRIAVAGSSTPGSPGPQGP